jgi:hypothetical protein
MKLTQEQRGEVIVEEAVFQLTIMGQYLRKHEKTLYISMLIRYMPAIHFDAFVKKNELAELVHEVEEAK